jgi:hypothetical protein
MKDDDEYDKNEALASYGAVRGRNGMGSMRPRTTDDDDEWERGRDWASFFLSRVQCVAETITQKV